MASNFAPEFRTKKILKNLKEPDKKIVKERASTNYKTTNYEWFDIGDNTNRDLNEGNLMKLYKSFERKVIDIPISVVLKPGKKPETKGCYIVRDGQHRLFIAKLRGLPILYNVVNNFDEDDVAVINSANAKWKSTDYLKRYVSKGNQNYINFNNWYAPYKNEWEISIFFNILNERSNSKSISSKNFNSGDLLLKNEEMDKLTKKSRTLRMFNEFVKSGHTRRYLFASIIKLLDIPQFDVIRLRDKLKVNLHMLNHHGLEESIKSVLDIYNKGLPASSPLRILPIIDRGKVTGFQVG